MPDRSSQPLLTVLIAADGDAQALTASIAAAAAIADEILIAACAEDRDSVQSTESWRGRKSEIVRCGSRLDDAAWRNECLAQSRGRWLLWLEAGETFAGDGAKSLRAFVQHRADPGCGYRLPVCVPPAAGGLAGEQISQIRLAPRDPAVRFEGRVCATLSRSLAEAGKRVETLPHRILRGEREHDPVRKTRRAERQLQAAEAAIAACGPCAAWLNVAADAAHTLGDARRAEELHRQALQSSDPGSRDMLEAYYGLLTVLDGREQTVDAQLALCIEALAQFPGDMQLLCAMGGYLQAQRRSHLAAQAFHVAYTQGVVNPDVWHLHDARGVAAVCHSRLLENQNKQPEAAEFLADALVQLPESVLVRRQLMEIQLRRGYTDAALALLDDMPLPPHEGAALRHAVIGACLARRQSWSSAISYLHRAFLAECRDPLCLRWLAAALLATNQIEQARLVLAEWRRIDPSCAEAGSLLQAIDSRSATSATTGRFRRVDLAHDGNDVPLPAASCVISADASTAAANAVK